MESESETKVSHHDGSRERINRKNKKKSPEKESSNLPNNKNKEMEANGAAIKPRKANVKMKKPTDSDNIVVDKTTSKYNDGNKKKEEGDKILDGVQMLMAMSSSDIEELLRRIDAQCPADDTKRDKLREAQISWESVAFSNYDSSQCKLAWFYLRMQARTYRILHELIDETRMNFKTNYNKSMRKVIESSPDFPKQPYALGGFQSYCKELWDDYKDIQNKMNANVENFLVFQAKCYQKWQNLSEKRKATYNYKASIVRAEYRNQVAEYYYKYPGFRPEILNSNDDDKVEEYKSTPVPDSFKQKALKISNEVYKDAPTLPNTPLQLFVNSKLSRLDPPPTLDEIPDLKHHYVGKWKTLSDAKKLKWVLNCIRNGERYVVEIREYKKSHPLYILPNIPRIISKEEYLIWAEDNVQPPPVPCTGSFYIFLKEFSDSEEAAGIDDEVKLRKLARIKWCKLDWYHKEIYRMKLKMQKVTFKKEWMSYYRRLPHLLKDPAFNVLPLKHKKFFQGAIDKLPLVCAEEGPGLVDTATKGHSEHCDSHNKAGKRKAYQSTNDETSQEEDEGISPKKRKKKNRKKAHEELEEVNLEQHVGESKSRTEPPLYMAELTDEQKTLIEGKLMEERQVMKEYRKKQRLREKNVNSDKEEEAIDEGRQKSSRKQTRRPRIIISHKKKGR